MSAPDSDVVATDLHGHSLYSDGRTTPEQYVSLRARKRLEVIALSDHDTFMGVSRAQAAASAHPALTLVPAMEATSFFSFGAVNAEQVHVLAYFPPSFLPAAGARPGESKLEKTALWARSVRVHEAWRSYLLDFVARQDSDVRAALDERALCAMSAAPVEFPQLQTFILRIAERCPHLFKAFQLDHVHFWDNRALFAWTPEELIEQIRADGGFDVVAHPIRYRDKRRLDRLFDAASGIEAYTSRHNSEVASRFRAIAEAKSKHWTASSDDHQHQPYVHPASGTPRRTVERILRGA